MSRMLVESKYRCRCNKRYDHVEVLFTPNEMLYPVYGNKAHSSVRIDLRYRCKWCGVDYKSEGLIRSRAL